MVPHKKASHVCCLIPFGFAWHIIRYTCAVDDKVLEGNSPHFALFVETGDDRMFGRTACVGKVTEGDVLDAETRLLAILLVMEDA